jgi:hypothetical protein
VEANVLTAMSGVLGSLVGGSATVATTWIAQRTASRRELIQGDIAKREVLYGEFIAECAKLIVDAYTHKLEKPEALIPLYALINRIRLRGSQPVLTEAEHLLRHITERYFARNLTVEELREVTRSADADPIKAFGEACRAELRSIRARV